MIFSLCKFFDRFVLAIGINFHAACSWDRLRAKKKKNWEKLNATSVERIPSADINTSILIFRSPLKISCAAHRFHQTGDHGAYCMSLFGHLRAGNAILPWAVVSIRFFLPPLKPLKINPFSSMTFAISLDIFVFERLSNQVHLLNISREEKKHCNGSRFFAQILFSRIEMIKEVQIMESVWRLCVGRRIDTCEPGYLCLHYVHIRVPSMEKWSSQAP